MSVSLELRTNLGFMAYELREGSKIGEKNDN